jgi:hypothetical protein
MGNERLGRILLWNRRLEGGFFVKTLEGAFFGGGFWD